MGERISGGGPPWAHVAWGRTQGVGRALHPRGQVVDRLLCSQCQIFSNIPEKIIFKFHGIWRTFIFGVFLYCTDNSENKQENTNFSLFQLNNKR